jgi:hypothetical protein
LSYDQPVRRNQPLPHCRPKGRLLVAQAFSMV